jgi:hypothetical protein
VRHKLLYIGEKSWLKKPLLLLPLTPGPLIAAKQTVARQFPRRAHRV